MDRDIKSFFDTLDHGLLIPAPCHHIKTRRVLLYAERCLKAPVLLSVKAGEGIKIFPAESVPANHVLADAYNELHLGCLFQVDLPQKRVGWRVT